VLKSDGMRGVSSKLLGAGSLLLLGLYVVAVGVQEPWPLGGPATAPSGLGARAAALALGLSLGWGVPGLCLAQLVDPRLGGARCLARAFALGVGYILATGLAYATVMGHAPGRWALLALLSAPAWACLFRRAPPLDDAGPRWILGAVLAMAALVSLLWGKLATESLNGDGTEAFELARSLREHPLPYWDLERSGGQGRFGTPLVNPFLTNSYFVSAEMALLGPGELAARLPIVPAAVLCAVAVAGLFPAAGRSGWTYLAAVTALWLLWNSYYVGYEPAFTDLAEPAASDMLMVALWLAGLLEIGRGSNALGVGFLLLASGILYSAPVLAAVLLFRLRGADLARGQRALVAWTLGLLGIALAALAYGAASGLLGTWIERLREEYWYDLVDTRRRTSSWWMLALSLLMTGGLPLATVWRRRLLAPVSRAALETAGAYLAIVLLHSYKNLHYLAPLPHLLALPALEATGARARALACAVLAVAFTASWPDQRQMHRENAELGAVSCVDGLDYEGASLAGGVVYDAFSRPGEDAWRFAVGKHTFVRYALELGRPDACRFRLSSTPQEGWILVARGQASFSVRDLDEYVSWRFRQPPIPESWLFRRSPQPALKPEARSWQGSYALNAAPGSALVVGGSPQGLLVPGGPGCRARLRVTGGATLRARVNGQLASELHAGEGSDFGLETSGSPWRAGWNLLQVAAPSNDPLELERLVVEGCER
jgi:hypothetical protein